MIEKNQNKIRDKTRRITWDMNLGTITHKSKKDYNRQKSKKEVKKYENEED